MRRAARVSASSNSAVGGAAAAREKIRRSEMRNFVNKPTPAWRREESGARLFSAMTRTSRAISGGGGGGAERDNGDGRRVCSPCGRRQSTTSASVDEIRLRSCRACVSARIATRTFAADEATVCRSRSTARPTRAFVALRASPASVSQRTRSARSGGNRAARGTRTAALL